MPFFLYRIEKNGGTAKYIREQQIVVGGKNGPFAKYVRERCPQADKDFFWEMSESDIV
jgi:hypothetical protein